MLRKENTYENQNNTYEGTFYRTNVRKKRNIKIEKSMFIFYTIYSELYIVGDI